MYFLSNIFCLDNAINHKPSDAYTSLETFFQDPEAFYSSKFKFFHSIIKGCGFSASSTNLTSWLQSKQTNKPVKAVDYKLDKHFFFCKQLYSQ